MFDSSQPFEYFELRVWLPGQGALRDMVRATSLRQAMLLAQIRYPGCLVEVPEGAAKLRPLARSSDGPKTRQRRRNRLLK